MSWVKNIVLQIFQHEVPPPPPPKPAQPPPTAEELRWAQAEAAALIRRARILDVDVELEQSGR